MSDDEKRELLSIISREWRIDVSLGKRMENVADAIQAAGFTKCTDSRQGETNA